MSEPIKAPPGLVDIPQFIFGEFQPTPELRFFRPIEQAPGSSPSIGAPVLQQKWIAVGYSAAMVQTVYRGEPIGATKEEWRDVPTVEEER